MMYLQHHDLRLKKGFRGLFIDHRTTEASRKGRGWMSTKDTIAVGLGSTYHSWLEKPLRLAGCAILIGIFEDFGIVDLLTQSHGDLVRHAGLPCRGTPNLPFFVQYTYSRQQTD
jgi:hypothetical protein